MDNKNREGGSKGGSGRNGKGEIAAVVGTIAVMAFSFGVMPSVLATPSKISDIQTIAGNQAVLGEGGLGDAAREVGAENDSAQASLNAIPEEQATQTALDALGASGFDLQEFERQEVETRYIAETAPAGDPIWAVIFRDDQEGYACVYGDEMNGEIRDKIAAVGEVEGCVDEDGTPGIRAHYSYTKYTVVEVDALNGSFLRYGEFTAELGGALHTGKIHWTPATEEDWEQERQRQEKLQQEME